MENEKTSQIDASRKYTSTGNFPTKYSGQVSTVITALGNIKSGKLSDFVAEVIRINPNYQTMTPITASVKYHLHQLKIKGFVVESL